MNVNESLNAVLESASEQIFSAGQAVLHYPAKHRPLVGYVRTGTLSCRVRLRMGEDEFNSHFVSAKHWIGLENLYPSTIAAIQWRAETDSTVAFLSTDQLEQALQDPKVGPGLALAVIQSANRLNHLIMRQRIVDQLPDDLRFDAAFRELVKIRGQREGDKIVLSGLTQSNIADHAGLSLSSVTRRLQKMRKDGQIEVKRRCIYINGAV